ncbi:hypothetical protein [Gloeobacter morelensis]|uniref:hypothetical protein n=1 Tax=Gloeobacter morelensis TaxID=2907343 RepID=UPI001E5454FC|nr:hypothetical protein [Gloeobacter morelensis]UFP97232.1 hypothetical protein ISF26_24225 [Gloeobacter morelensis MG652769]
MVEKKLANGGIKLNALDQIKGDSLSKNQISLERLAILILVGIVGVETLLWQNEKNKPIPSFVVDSQGKVELLKPVAADYRTPEEIKEFAERTYRGIYGWNHDSKTEGGVKTDVKLAMFGLDGELAQSILDVFDKAQIYQKVDSGKINTHINYKTTKIIHAENPYTVILEGSMYSYGLNEIKPTYFRKKLTIAVSERSSPFNLNGLTITDIEDLSPGEKNASSKEKSK